MDYTLVKRFNEILRKSQFYEKVRCQTMNCGPNNYYAQRCKWGICVGPLSHISLARQRSIHL